MHVHAEAVGARPGQSAVADYNTSVTYLRCDDGAQIYLVNPISGCVNVHWTPKVSFPSSTYPEISKNIAAGKAIKKDAGPVGNPLIEVDRAQRDANRNATCRNATYRDSLIGPKPPDDSNTGASSQQGGPGNSLMWVPEGENRNQEAVLKNFYESNRIIPGDNFLVE